jgi:ABC-2 type transport system permease protein/lipopolysaccharide transport system permease protein
VLSGAVVGLEPEPDVEPDASLLFRRRIRLGSTAAELWSNRGLVRTLAERELRVRYKQTILGFAWALITPFALMLVFTLFVDRVANVQTGDVPYPLYAYLGLIPWTFFSTSVSQGGLSLLSNVALLNKVYCPREVFPLASVGVAVVDSAIATAGLVVMFVAFTTMPELTIVWIPVLLAVQVAFTLGVVLVISAVVLYFRDVRHALPLALQLGLFETPVAFGLQMVPESVQPVYAFLNPLAPVIDGYRQTVLYGAAPELDLLALGALSSIMLLMGGYLLFKRLEMRFADIV